MSKFVPKAMSVPPPKNMYAECAIQHVAALLDRRLSVDQLPDRKRVSG